MKTKTFFIAVFFATFNIYSQAGGSPPINPFGPGVPTSELIARNIDLVNPNGGIRYNGMAQNQKAVGSIHLFTNWDGNYVIQSTKGMRYSLNSLNYNLQTKKLESLLSKDSIFELKIDNIDFIIASNKRYKVVNNELYQELIPAGKYKLYKQFKVKLQDAFQNPMTKAESEPAEFIQETNYLYLENGILIPFKLKKKDIISIFKDKESEIKKFVSEKDIVYSEEKDVIRIFNYYNTL